MDQLEHEVSITEVLMKDAFINSSTVAPEDEYDSDGTLSKAESETSHEVGTIGLRVHVLF